ncbi:unnamed protein product [Trypanosoma congolense IL3000]|uniref:WGS project CAEQ00000000 data, annotated contig 1747 n=1 Tax=Trypanosoma congolense (strain IL3000) TaxID=1068625 RepID=F9W8M2_TRYCI|nr:unnamed protein product [Trypanosoma congolense IL3000]
MIIHSPCTQHIAGIGNSSAVTLPSALVCCLHSILRSTVHTATPHLSQPPFNHIVRSSSHTATQAALTAYFHFTENNPTEFHSLLKRAHTQVSPNDTHSKHHPPIPNVATGLTKLQGLYATRGLEFGFPARLGWLLDREGYFPVCPYLSHRLFMLYRKA